ncbi:IS91 family transposase [Salinivibrio kushneri]|uniref:IS91 family transposase n=1 Tax=Salinivibrio kushneri TaxID=1908198 RepID=UPI000C83420B|nr:transposase [Salinivibrio kushneri]WBA13408.1 transposase [Salinivibrio kushneri]
MSTFIQLLQQHTETMPTHSMTPDIARAISAMTRCRTGALGQSQWACQGCHYDERTPLSCGHRHCPQCQHPNTVQWLERQTTKLLPTTYFMVTFTLPATLRHLAHMQAKSLYALMFSVAASVLKDFAQRKHGADSGFTLVLHTHNRRRDMHPHLHAIVPAGFYHPTRKQWHKGNKQYLYPHAALASVWRARVLAAINAHPVLSLPPSVPKTWVVDCRAVGRGLPALKYLSRYLYRGVLPDKDIIDISDHQVTFRYTDSQTNQSTTRSLPTNQFLMLILQHVLPKGLQRVRDYGLLHGSAKHKRYHIQRMLLHMAHQTLPVEAAPEQHTTRCCPTCGERLMVCVGVTRPR